MKKCTSCGAEFDSSAVFCGNCGERLSENAPEFVDEIAPEAACEAPSDPENASCEVIAEEILEPEEPADSDSTEIKTLDFVEDFVSDEPEALIPAFGVYRPKKYRSGKWWKVLLAVFAGILAVIMMFVTMVTVYVPMLSTSEYSKGEVRNGVYANEFADLYFEMDTRWKNAPISDYNACESANGENCECGLYATRDNTELVVMFISGADGTDAEDILENSAEQYKDENALEDALLGDVLRDHGVLDGTATVSVDVVSVSDVGETEIATSYYDSMSIEYDIIINGTVYKNYRTLCVRVIDDYAVVIQVTSDNERAVESALKSFETIPFEYYYQTEYYYDLSDENEGAY